MWKWNSFSYRCPLELFKKKNKCREPTNFKVFISFFMFYLTWSWGISILHKIPKYTLTRRECVSENEWGSPEEGGKKIKNLKWYGILDQERLKGRDMNRLKGYIRRICRDPWDWNIYYIFLLYWEVKVFSSHA